VEAVSNFRIHRRLLTWITGAPINEIAAEGHLVQISIGPTNGGFRQPSAIVATRPFTSTPDVPPSEFDPELCLLRVEQISVRPAIPSAGGAVIKPPANKPRLEIGWSNALPEPTNFGGNVHDCLANL